MDELLPIIRRQRRPLMAAEDERPVKPAAVVNVQPVQAVEAEPVEPVVVEKPVEPEPLVEAAAVPAENRSRLVGRVMVKAKA